MPIHRLVIRIDYDLVFDALDRPGKIIEVIAKTHTNYFTSFNEAVNDRAIFCEYGCNEQGIYRQIYVTPKHSYFILESREGINLDNILENDDFKKLCKYLDEITKHFSLGTIGRAGFRIFYCDALGGKNANTLEKHISLINKEYISATKDTMGEINDISININGISESEVQYQVRMGPFVSSDLNGLSFDIEEDKVSSYKFTADIDCYEKNFSATSFPVNKWCKPIVSMMNELITKHKAILVS